MQERQMLLVQHKPDVARLQQEALALAAKPTKSFHAFARALWAAHSNDPTFLYEVERVAGVKRRTLFYLSRVGGFLADYSITEEQAERIGWTKIQIVARHVANQPERISQHAMQAKLGIAARTPAHALSAALEAQNAPSQGPLRSVLLRLPAEQYADVEAALIACGAEPRGKGLVGKEDAVVRLAQCFLDKSDRAAP